MKFKIDMYVKATKRWIEMPGMQDLNLFEATRLTDLYKKRNGNCNYAVINQENGDIEYET